MTGTTYIDAAAMIYATLISRRERRAAMDAAIASDEKRLGRILDNAVADGHARAAINDAAFDEASRRIAAKARPKMAGPPGIEGTPLGDLLA